MPNTSQNRQTLLNGLLDFIHARIAWIAHREEQAAWVNGYGANGEFDAERTRLIRHAGQVLDALERVGGSPRYRPVR